MPLIELRLATVSTEVNPRFSSSPAWCLAREVNSRQSLHGANDPLSQLSPDKEARAISALVRPDTMRTVGTGASIDGTGSASSEGKPQNVVLDHLIRARSISFPSYCCCHCSLRTISLPCSRSVWPQGSESTAGSSRPLNVNVPYAKQGPEQSTEL